MEWRAWEETEWIAQEAEQRVRKEQWRVEAERHKAKAQVKKCVSHFWFVMTELTVLGGGGHCATAWKG